MPSYTLVGLALTFLAALGFLSVFLYRRLGYPPLPELVTLLRLIVRFTLGFVVVLTGSPTAVPLVLRYLGRGG